MANTELLSLVQDEKKQAFNAAAESLNGVVDLSGGHFRGYDLRAFFLKRANFQNAYFRNADMRGLDLSEATLDGASLKGANVSGALFPPSITADEIRLSLEFGTRLRAKS